MTEYNKNGILIVVNNQPLESCVCKPLLILHGDIKTPPLSSSARIETGTYLRQLQLGIPLGMPISRPMPSIGKRCAELRIVDENVTWRIIYRIDEDAVLVVEVFAKKTRATPRKIITVCKQRLNAYDSL